MASRVSCCAAVLALVSRLGIWNPQHRCFYIHIVYKKKVLFSETWQMMITSEQGVFSCFYCWPCIGWLLTFVHSISVGKPPLTWHLKLTDSPWRTVAARGSTVTTRAWPATVHTERDRDNKHNLMPSAYLNLQIGLGKTQSKQTATPKQTTRANTQIEQECFWWQCKKKKKKTQNWNRFWSDVLWERNIKITSSYKKHLLHIPILEGQFGWFDLPTFTDFCLCCLWQ